jgi:SAM-dependent methyltransferase
MTDLKSEYDSCLVCEGNEWTTVREEEDLYRPEYQKKFRLTCCRCCGLVMQNPKPGKEELGAAYSVAYACYRPAWKEPGWPLWKILRAWTARRRVAWLKRYGTGHELLEVGCGAGDFIIAAHRMGWNVSAIEYNSSMVDIIRRELGFDVRAGELASGLWNEGRFDAVAFWNVLEHVPDPLRDLSIAANYLRPGGKVLLNIPTRQAAECGQWFGKYWAMLDLPRHLYFYDEATLSKICSKAGFDLAAYKTPFVQSAWGYYMSCWNWANGGGKGKLRWLRFMALAAVVTMFMPIVAMRATRKHGLEAFAVAVKR